MQGGPLDTLPSAAQLPPPRRGACRPSSSPDCKPGKRAVRVPPDAAVFGAAPLPEACLSDSYKQAHLVHLFTAIDEDPLQPVFQLAA